MKLERRRRSQVAWAGLLFAALAAPVLGAPGDVAPDSAQEAAEAAAAKAGDKQARKQAQRAERERQRQAQQAERQRLRAIKQAERDERQQAKSFTKEFQLESEQLAENVDKLQKLLTWHDDLAEARAAAVQANKPILWIQALGDLSGLL